MSQTDPAVCRSDHRRDLSRTSGTSRRRYKLYSRWTTGLTTVRSDTQRCRVSYLLPWGFSASPWTQPRLEGSPAGGSKGRDTRTPLVTYEPLQPSDIHCHFKHHRHNSYIRAQHQPGISASPPLLLLVHTFTEEVWFGKGGGERRCSKHHAEVQYRSHTTTNPHEGFPTNRKPFCTGHLHRALSSQSAEHTEVHRGDCDHNLTLRHL